MTDKEIYILAKEIAMQAKKDLNSSEEKSTTPEVWPVDQQQEGSIEEQKEKEKTPDEPDKQYSSDPQDSMEGVLSTIVQKVKESSNPSSNESKEDADKKKDENT